MQEYNVKCQSTFERIREAYADIFGFQYRPAESRNTYEKNECLWIFFISE